jgi:transcriptional regulator with XRE-family HTH domain
MTARHNIREAQLAIAGRLKKLRERTNLSARAFAMMNKFSVPAYYSHESGERSFSIDVANAYAKVLGVSVEDILGADAVSDPPKKDPSEKRVFGNTEKIALQLEQTTKLWIRRRLMPIVGTISAPSARVTRLPEGGISGEVTFIEDDTLQCFLVVGDEVPGFYDGDSVFHEPYKKDLDARLINGKECVCKNERDEEQIRVCSLQANGLWTLRVPHTKDESLIERDIRLMAAGRVRHIMRNA